MLLLWLHLFILSGVISPLISSSILGTYCPGEFIFQCPIFLPCHTVHGFSRQEYWSGLPFPSPMDHILSELSTMTHSSWVALHSMAHSFIGLDKAVVHVIRLVIFWDCGFQSVCYRSILLWWRRIRGYKPPIRSFLMGKLGLVLMGGAMLSKSWHQGQQYLLKRAGPREAWGKLIVSRGENPPTQALGTRAWPAERPVVLSSPNWTN